MGGIGGVSNRSDEKNYCGELDDVESALRSVESPPSAPTARTNETGSDEHVDLGPSDSASQRVAPAPPREPDYWTLSVGIGAVVGASVSATLDRHGHIYLGVGGGLSASPAVTASLTKGQMVGTAEPKERELRNLLEGDAISASAGAIHGAGIMNSPGGTAIERGIYVPQAGVSFEHSWEVSSRGPRW